MGAGCRMGVGRSVEMLRLKVTSLFGDDSFKSVKFSHTLFIPRGAFTLVDLLWCVCVCECVCECVCVCVLSLIHI